MNSFPGIGRSPERRCSPRSATTTRFRDVRGLKSYAGSAPITVASGKSPLVHRRKVKNQRLAAVGYMWIFGLSRHSGQTALRPPPGAR